MRSIRVPLVSMRPAFDGSAATWVLIQQVAVRGLAAVKFLAIGRMLGPAAIGSVGVALLAVAIAEALSDTGLAQAVVQAKAMPTRPELGAVWTTLTARGLLIGLLLIALAPVMNAQFHLGGSLLLLQLAAALPLILRARFACLLHRSARAALCSNSPASKRSRPSPTARSASFAHGAARESLPC